MPPLTAYVVSHTHWDREWYQPFQEFRVRLVAMVDRLLTLLDSDPDYRYFMLDGQTIVLDDYLAIRPERRGELARHVASGRLLVGPWYILPDEFLVGPESLVRNLLGGRKIARGFGDPMPVGYIPDTFGHISQLPQVLTGFGLDTTAIWRGLPDLPTVLTWRSPDGSCVMAANLREGYGDLAWAPAEVDGFTATVRIAVGRLATHAPVPYVLLTDGTDHLEARPDLPGLLAVANERLAAEGLRLVHSTLPGYFKAVHRAAPVLVRADGEFRGSRRSNILPGVLSARMWIKQRNRAVETVLTSWAEPFTALAAEVAPEERGLTRAATAGLLAEAWRLLLQNQPHDSVCGCSVDQVHEEMRSRYDQAEQIGEELTRRALSAIAGQIGGEPGEGAPAIPVVVFNPASGPASGAVVVSVQIPPSWPGIMVVDAAGRVLPHALTGRERMEFSSLGVDPMDVVTRLSTESAERIVGQEVLSLTCARKAGQLHITALLGGHGLGDRAAVARAAAGIRSALAAETSLVPVFHIDVVPRTELTIAVDVVPACGYASLTVRPAPASSGDRAAAGGAVIENEYLRVAADPDDGCLTVTDKRNGHVYAGLNRLVDDGDRGDEYNFCPVPGDTIVPWPAGKPVIAVHRMGEVGSTLEVHATFRLPAGLVAGRGRRSARTVPVSVVSRVKVVRGVARVDIETTVDNRARDHRLRIAFPFPAAADVWRTETPWDVVERPVAAPDLETDPAYDDWQERPVAQQPQSRFCDVSAPGVGLMLANRGLPEAEARRGAQGGVTLYLTLLRCTGWLSRDDLPVRKGHAGPGLPTPGAQCLGRYTFDYSIIPHDGDWLAAMPPALGFAAPPRAVVGPAGRGGALAPSCSFVGVEPACVMVSALKSSEDGRSIVLRLWNASGQAVTARVRLGFSVAGARLARLDETPGVELQIGGDGVVAVPMRGKQAVTVLVTSSEEGGPVGVVS